MTTPLSLAAEGGYPATDLGPREGLTKSSALWLRQDPRIPTMNRISFKIVRVIIAHDVHALLNISGGGGKNPVQSNFFFEGAAHRLCRNLELISTRVQPQRNKNQLETAAAGIAYGCVSVPTGNADRELSCPGNSHHCQTFTALLCPAHCNPYNVYQLQTATGTERFSVCTSVIGPSGSPVQRAISWQV